jgi:hypothetical protein
VVKTFSAIAILAITGQLTILTTLHVLPTGYRPLRDAISDYGVGRYRRYFWAQLLAGAIACTCLALALAGLHPYAPKVVVALLVANAVARVMMPAFPTDQSGNRFGSRSGTIHMLLAFLAFGAVAASATGLGGLASHYTAWHGIKSLVGTLGWIVLVGAVATALALVGPRLKQIFGLIERLFTASVIVWIYVISIELYRFAPR